MKKLFATATLFALPFTLLAQLADMIEMPEDVSSERPERYSDDELLRTWGWLLAERFNLEGIEITERELEVISEGMRAKIQGKEPPADLQKAMLPIQEYFTKREQKIVERQLAENRKKEREFFDTLVGLPDVKRSGTGLHYTILKPGSEVKPKPEDTVIVRYEGRFLDNTVFDSTEGRPPAAFKLQDVIPGWTQGVQLIGEGGKVKLYVPAELAYGDEPRPNIPPGSPLVFEVELVKVGLPEQSGDSEAEAVETSEPVAEDSE